MQTDVQIVQGRWGRVALALLGAALELLGAALEGGPKTKTGHTHETGPTTHTTSGRVRYSQNVQCVRLNHGLPYLTKVHHVCMSRQ